MVSNKPRLGISGIALATDLVSHVLALCNEFSKNM
jgi:hypothetical protein